MIKNFKDFHNLITISFSLYLTKIEEDAFLRCYNLKELSFYRNDMAACDDSFFNNLPSNVLCLCHYNEIENSTFQTFLNKNFSTKSFEGTERFTSIYDDVSCANQYDGIKNLTKKSYYIDENGERVYYTQSWGYTACVTTSTAMMIERRAYLDDYKAQVGDFDQKTVAAIVKEISYDYILVNYSWDFVWGEHTSSYETLTKDDVPYEVTTNSYDRHNISQKTLQEYLSHHPEGVVAFNTQHAVLVIDYIEDGDDAGKYVVWDPATGNEHIRSFNSLNGNRGFKLDHIIYVDSTNYEMSYLGTLEIDHNRFNNSYITDSKATIFVNLIEYTAGFVEFTNNTFNETEYENSSVKVVNFNGNGKDLSELSISIANNNFNIKYFDEESDFGNSSLNFSNNTIKEWANDAYHKPQE